MVPISVITLISLKLYGPSSISEQYGIGSQSRKCSEMIEWKQRVEKLHQFQVETKQKNSCGELIRYFVDFESRNHFEISTLNRCHNFHVDSPFKIAIISTNTNIPCGILTTNHGQIDEDVSIVLQIATKIGIHHRFFIGDNSTGELSLVESFFK